MISQEQAAQIRQSRPDLYGPGGAFTAARLGTPMGRGAVRPPGTPSMQQLTSMYAAGKPPAHATQAVNFEKAYTGSPAYQFQVDEGNANLDKQLAAQGLRGSGAELELKRRMMADVGAREASEIRAASRADADRLASLSTSDANRAANMFQYQTGQNIDVARGAADRTERYRNNDRQFQADNMFRIADLMLSQNPMQYAYGATGAAAQVDQRYQDRANQRIEQGYRRVASPGGGGGAAPRMSINPDLMSLYLQGLDAQMRQNYGNRVSAGQASSGGTDWGGIAKAIPGAIKTISSIWNAF